MEEKIKPEDPKLLRTTAVVTLRDYLTSLQEDLGDKPLAEVLADPELRHVAKANWPKSALIEFGRGVGYVEAICHVLNVDVELLLASTMCGGDAPAQLVRLSKLVEAMSAFKPVT